ncbi:helix-turn-helix domain-containing protein [Paenibacillus endophyticus]|nr:helix-turn-helix domain-containing protein [Paenibacillus endophyticus]
MWFRRLLLSYLPIFFIVTMILFVVFFQTLNEQNRREAIKANDFLAQQVILFTDNSLKAIDYQVVREILTNPDISHFFSRDSMDVAANIKALKVMDELKFNYPIIDSIYFMRFKDEFIFGDVPRTYEDFQDKSFIEKYEEQESGAKWSGERTYKAFSDSDIDAENVISLVRTAPFNMGVKQGYFVVNVSLSKLQDTVSRMYNSDISFVSMIDDEGRNLLGDEVDPSATGPVLANYTSPYTGWEINSGILDKNGLKFVLTFYNVWVVFAIAVVVFGILWVIYVTKRNYKPIQQLVSLIQTYSSKSEGAGATSESEFIFIQNTLENLMSETKQFQQQYREKLILQKKYHFHQVLEGAVQMTDEAWISELRSYDLDVKGKISTVHVIEIDDYFAFQAIYNERDQSLLKFTLYSVIHETAKNLGVTVWAEWTTDRRVSFILWLPQEANVMEKNDYIIQECRTWIEQNVSFNITIGRGEPANTLEELRGSYEKANYCLQYKAVLGSNRIIALEDTIRPQTEIQEYFKTIYLLSQSLRLAENEWLKYLNLFFDQIRDSLLPRKEIESLLQFFVHHLEGEVLELSKEYRNIWRAVHTDLRELAMRWDNLDDLQQGCSSIFAMMNEKMQMQRESHSNKALFIEIRTYIEENYANSELSLDFLSNRFQFNSKYLSKMFKEEFGENFVDFLIGLRIANAKQMLSKTQKPMQEISSEVGYYNYNSFNRAFKNVVGLSPRDFRKQLGEGS